MRFRSAVRLRSGDEVALKADRRHRGEEHDGREVVGRVLGGPVVNRRLREVTLDVLLPSGAVSYGVSHLDVR